MLIHHAPDGVWGGQFCEIGDREPIPQQPEYPE